MSFVKNTTVIEDGDLVLAWINRSDVIPLKIKSGETLQTRYGPFRHDDIIGKPAGTQQASMNGQGFIYLLAPTPELWAISLPHRTQIVYSPDGSYIVSRLRIRPESRVIESGTGSGAFTHALARTVSTSGQIRTYEYHQARCEQAAKEFEEHGLGDIARITHRNVCEDGFKLNGERFEANAVFLDLPAPWLAIPFLMDGMLDRTRQVYICCFSPCVEQVIKTIFALREAGFQNIEMTENQARRWEGHKAMRKSLDEALDVIRDVRVRRQDGMDRRQERDQARAQGETLPSLKRKREPYNPWGRGLRVREGTEGYAWDNVSWVENEIKTHTSYLTFAVLPPMKPAKYIKA